MDKILSINAMGVWARSPEKGCVNRLWECHPVRYKLMVSEMMWR